MIPPCTRLALVMLAALAAAGSAAAAPADETSPHARAWGQVFHLASRDAWKVPVAARAGCAGIVVVRCRFHADGSAPDVEEEAARGPRELSDAGVVAVRVAVAALEPPPFSDGDDGFTIHYTFTYNMTKAQVARWQRRHVRKAGSG